MESSKKLLKQKDVAEQLGVSTPTVRKFRQEGKLKGYKIGSRLVMFRPEEVKEFIEKSKC